MERGGKEKINEWKINRKALDPSLIPPTGRLSEASPLSPSAPSVLRLMGLAVPQMDPLIPNTHVVLTTCGHLCQMQDSGSNVSSRA